MCKACYVSVEVKKGGLPRKPVNEMKSLYLIGKECKCTKLVINNVGNADHFGFPPNFHIKKCAAVRCSEHWIFDIR